MEARTVSFSQTTLTELMIPSYANFGGKVHGGILLSLMDKVAYACASRHAGCYVVTVSVDEVNFLQPVNVGELISLQASVNYVGKSSMVIGIRIVSLDVKSGIEKHTNTSYFNMVAKDEQGRPCLVPPLILENEEELRRCIESIKRKKMKSDNQEHFDNETARMNLAQDRILLNGERIECLI